MTKTFQNPIIPGFYPDPSICRVDEEYYLVTSTFEYFPGLPIFHSRDLVHWRQIGHVLDRPSQLPLDGLRPSAGLFAPTIRYHEGTFYVINTLVMEFGKARNFIVTAVDPAGPWSEPYYLDDAPGIDPSLLFDDDGRAWYCGNRPPPGGEQYRGHREIWLQELDLEAMQLTGEKQSLWDGAVKGNLHCEAPHLYKIDGTYYLMVAEAGTGHNHAVTIARSEAIAGPYEVNPRNPILTHRNLGLDYPIVGTGHADLVETQNGEWWMVCLAMRPYGGYYYNLGRETFLTPVRWEDGWPIVSPGVGRVEFEHPVPDLPEHRWPSKPACDQFEADHLDFCWNFLRTPREEFYTLAERPGYLRLKLRPQMLSEWANPSFVGRRQQHIHFAARTAMEFTPQAENECAGVVLLQNSDFHFRLVVAQGSDGPVVRLIARTGDEDARRRMFERTPAERERRKQHRERLLAELQEGDIRKGEVISICDFGAFVDLGGAEGLIHLSELSWRHVSHPSEVLQVGDEVEVYVLNVDRDRKRIGLSLKRLEPDPGSPITGNHRIGQLVEGTATRESTLAERPIDAGRVYLKVEAHGQAYSFYVANVPEAWQPVAENVDGRILSTPLAGGFVGAYVGMYASSNGQASGNFADFGWFEYTELGA